MHAEESAYTAFKIFCYKTVLNLFIINSAFVSAFDDSLYVDFRWFCYLSRIKHLCDFFTKGEPGERGERGINGFRYEHAQPLVSGMQGTKGFLTSYIIYVVVVCTGVDLPKILGGTKILGEKGGNN